MARKRDKYGEWRETDLREGEPATGQFGFNDEDRTFAALHLPACPMCHLRPTLFKKAVGSQSKYALRCQGLMKDWTPDYVCNGPSNTPWMNNRSQAVRVWRMNVLLAGGKL